MHGIARLGFQGIPVRGNRRNKHFVPRLEISDQRADLDHLGATFMPQDQIVPFTDSAFPKSMNIGRANGDG
jgi:hypothetical protein